MNSVPVSLRSKFLLALLGTIFLGAVELSATSISGGGVTVETTPTPDASLQAPISTAPIAPYKPELTAPTATPKSILGGKALPPLPSVIPSQKIQELVQPQAAPALDEFGKLMQSAQTDFQNQKMDEALKKVDKAEAMRPDSPDLMNFRGAIYAETDRYDEARDLYEKALKMQPLSFWPKFNLAEIEFMQKKYSLARTKFEEALKLYPDNELLRFKIVLTYLLENNESGARAELERFKFPSDTAAYYFAFAAVEYAHGNKKAGDDWVDSSVRIFGMANTDFLYQSIAALGWVPLPRPQPGS